ncbi:kelch domain-containing protein 2 isoform X2 [Petaurus breviceps papuanus]|uniref:kelch domain-containing protein 2 isoform X2 n=1 Tax=Petaurus breviceps papuanus TaxID=3040969 RepID=UPI0036DC4122
MADGEEEELQAVEPPPGPADPESSELLEAAAPAERSGHVAVSDGRHMLVWGGYKNAQVRGFYDFYLPRDEIWIYNMETGRWLIFFGGYGYLPEDKQLGTFEFDETSFWNSSHPRGWNDHVHVLDTETFTWKQPITTGKPPSPRAAHACATVGNKGFVFGGRYRDSRMNDLHYLNLDTWEWNELIPQGLCPVGRSWHSLTPVSSDHLFLFGGFTTDKQPLSDAWTYWINKNEWIQFKHSHAEKPRLWHTACASDEGEVIVFGGCANNLLAQHKAAHSNELLVFSVQPKSLVRLSLEAVICFKDLLASSWNCLPKHLLHSVTQRFGSNNTSGS